MDSETQEVNAPSLGRVGELAGMEGRATTVNSRPVREGTLHDKGTDDASLVVGSSEKEYAGSDEEETTREERQGGNTQTQDGAGVENYMTLVEAHKELQRVQQRTIEQ